jgi:hypothetical protein
LVSEAEAEAAPDWQSDNQIRAARTPVENPMTKIAFAALAALGIMLGTAGLSTHANAYYSFAPPAQNAGSNS